LRSALPGDGPEAEVAYDHARHAIQITQEGGETAEFADRPERFLFMEIDPKSNKLKPAMEWGCPVFYHLAREVEGGAPGTDQRDTE